MKKLQKHLKANNAKYIKTKLQERQHVSSRKHNPPTTTGMPDFQSWQERGEYFRDHADYFTVVSKANLSYSRSEYKTLPEAEKHAQTKAVVAGGGWLIYAVIGGQSALVKAVRASKGPLMGGPVVDS